MLRLWNRLVNMKEERLTKLVFHTDFKSTHGWCKEIKDVFESMNMLPAYEHKSACDLKECEMLLTSKAQEEWREIVLSKPKLRTYATFKDKFETTDYIKINLSRFDRSLMSKFRCGILQLHIETGRFNQTKVEDRFCNICKEGFIEDELHFLCICSEYISDVLVFLDYLGPPVFWT